MELGLSELRLKQWPLRESLQISSELAISAEQRYGQSLALLADILESQQLTARRFQRVLALKVLRQRLLLRREGHRGDQTRLHQTVQRISCRSPQR